jgi:hypothetical protein
MLKLEALKNLIGFSMEEESIFNYSDGHLMSLAIESEDPNMRQLAESELKRRGKLADRGEAQA